MKKAFKRVGIVVGSLVILGIIVMLYTVMTNPISIRNLVKEYDYWGVKTDINQQLTANEVAEDAKQIIDLVESTHPIFLEGENSKYKAAKEQLHLETQKEMTVGMLQVFINRYLSSLQDGHTQIYWQEDGYLEKDFCYRNGKVFVMVPKKDSSNLQAEVKTIGGVPVEKIIEFIKVTFAAENEAGERVKIENYIKYKGIIELAGGNKIVTNTVPIEISVDNQKEDIISTIQPYYIDPYKTNTVSFEQMGDVAYIKLGTCEVNRELEAVATSLNQALQRGTHKVIIDVRDNAGGDSSACTRLLETMDMEGGNYGVTLRYSKLAKEQRGYVRTKGTWTHRANNQASKPNPNIALYVLTNEKTFSSATMLAVWVQDGKLGQVVGQPSGNMPSSYGDVLNYALKNSHLVGQVSHKKWLRPDTTKNNERELVPNVLVASNQDVLEVALDLLSKIK
ncbi:MAG: S41 family peptidase [Cellulosilyticaceae bacterium]